MVSVGEHGTQQDQKEQHTGIGVILTGFGVK